MSRKFIVVALVAASSFVGFSSESEAGHHRRGKRMGHCSHGAVQPSSCNTGCEGYATNPTTANYGYVGGSHMGYGHVQSPVYAAPSSSMVGSSTSDCGCGGAAQVGYSNGQQASYAN